ncbi:hypothetical protein QBC44DRAFT_80958 [Cladorrhinum sp. PSN332]|nr:hypothetical protein QBC44DRAFT_80958 [Cladorrhinum sp. PSN332]
MTTKAQRLMPWAAGSAALSAITVMGLTGFIANAFRGFYPNHSANLMLFNSIWSILVLAYIGLGPRFFPVRFCSIAAVAMEWATAILWCAGFFTLLMPVVFEFDFGRYCGLEPICGSFVAAEIFGLFSWVLFTFIAVMDTIAVRSNGLLCVLHNKPSEV